MSVERIAERISTLIRMAGSASALARMCGVSESVVRKWRDGQSEPSLAHCNALAKGSGVMLSWLATGEGPMRAYRVADGEAGAYTIGIIDAGTWDRAKRIVNGAVALIEAEPDVEAFADQVSMVYNEIVGRPQDNEDITMLFQRVGDALRSGTAASEPKKPSGRKPEPPRDSDQ